MSKENTYLRLVLVRDGKALIVRHQVGSDWDLPGGSVDLSEAEDIDRAARDGLAEIIRDQLGIDLARDQLNQLGTARWAAGKVLADVIVFSTELLAASDNEIDLSNSAYDQQDWLDATAANLDERLQACRIPRTAGYIAQGIR